MPIADPDAYPAVIVNDKLGESAGSLLFEILRLQHGYTYGAYSGFSQGNLINTFQAWSSVQATVTRESLTLLRDILKNYGTDYSQQWLDHSKEAMLRTMNGALETPNAQLNMLRTIVLFGLPDDYVKQRENTLKTFTLDQAKTVIGKYLELRRHDRRRRGRRQNAVGRGEIPRTGRSGAGRFQRTADPVNAPFTKRRSRSHCGNGFVVFVTPDQYPIVKRSRWCISFSSSSIIATA